MNINPRLVAPAIVLLLGALGAFLIVATRGSEDATPAPPASAAVRVVTVELETLRHRVRTHGTVTPRSEGDLTPEVSGRVVWISPDLESGGFFEAGEPLLRIDPHDYEVALERTKANLARSEAAMTLARKELARQQNLAGQSVASEANLDNAINAEQAAEASLREARAAKAQAERDLARTELLAPYRGRVREESVDVGQFVNRGVPIARLYAVDFAEVRLPVPDSQLAFLDVPLTTARGEADTSSSPKVDLSAEFAGATRHWQGKVVRTEGEIDPRTRMLHVVARVDDPYRRSTPDAPAADEVPLAVGLFVDAEIEGREVRDVVLLPRTAMRDGEPDPQGGYTRNRVFVAGDDGRLHFRTVEVVRALRDAVIIAEGVEPGERVIVSPLEAPVDGMRIRILESPS